MDFLVNIEMLKSLLINTNVLRKWKPFPQKKKKKLETQRKEILAATQPSSSLADSIGLPRLGQPISTQGGRSDHESPHSQESWHALLGFWRPRVVRLSGGGVDVMENLPSASPCRGGASLGDVTVYTRVAFPRYVPSVVRQSSTTMLSSRFAMASMVSLIRSCDNTFWRQREFWSPRRPSPSSLGRWSVLWMIGSSPRHLHAMSDDFQTMVATTPLLRQRGADAHQATLHDLPSASAVGNVNKSPLVCL